MLLRRPSRGSQRRAARGLVGCAVWPAEFAGIVAWLLHQSEDSAAMLGADELAAKIGNVTLDGGSDGARELKATAMSHHHFPLFPPSVHRGRRRFG